MGTVGAKLYTEDDVKSWRDSVARLRQSVAELESTVATMRKYNDELLTKHLALLAELNAKNWRMW